MLSTGFLPFLTAAFGFGLFHAMDTDHLIAVSGLIGTRLKPKKLWVFCSHWALGHSLTLMTIGAGVLLLGLAVPYELSQLAEKFIGFILLGIGLWALCDGLNGFRLKSYLDNYPLVGQIYWKSRYLRLDFHFDRRSSKAVLVGMVHGLAGSAPLLALLPMAENGSQWTNLIYLVFFSMGVLFSMVIFGGLFGVILHWAQAKIFIFAFGIRMLISVCSITFGGYWIYAHF